MKILFYCPFKFNLESKLLNQLGGIETLNIDLAKKLTNFKYEIYLATYCEKIIKKNKIINIPIKKIFDKNYNFDIIISSNYPTIFNYFDKQKKILWLHNTLAIEKSLRKGFLLPILFNKINTIFVSNYLNKITSILYLFNTKQVISNFLPKIFEKNKKNYNRKKIFVWSVQRSKGLQETLFLWSEKIFIRKKDIKLYIFGINKKLFKTKLEYYKKRNIFFFDRVPKKKLKSIYSKSLAMICLGYDETFCLNALEANSCGLPVLTLGETALKQLITNNKNGFVVKNFDELANKILDLSTSKINKDIINYCYKYSKNFYLDKIVTNWLKVIKK